LTHPEKLVPRETAERLRIYSELLREWNRRITLISGEPSAENIYSRHIADSLQLIHFCPAGEHWLDIGSGAGFPGMVLAIALSGRVVVHCVESDRRKCAFLREVARSTGASAIVHASRIEDIHPERLGPIDAVTARAFAGLLALVSLSRPWLTRGAVGIFPRGKVARAETAAIPPEFETRLAQSETDKSSSIVVIRQRRPGPP